MKTKVEYLVLTCFSFFALLLICIPSTVQAGWSGSIQVTGVSSEAQGAGIAFVNLDSNPRPEMILMSYNDSSGTKVFRYKIGWNVGTNGVASSWSSTTQVAGVGSQAQGAGIAFANLDSNPRPEMILMAYDNTSGIKTFRYKIGWNVGTNGVASSWSPVYQVAGGGLEAQGAGIAFANLDSDPRPEIILMAYENSQLANIFKYTIGWNVNTSGVASSWTSAIPVPSVGVFPKEAQGADLAIYDINGDGKNDMVLMSYDNPAGTNFFRYQIGWDFMYTGTVKPTGDSMAIDPTRPVK
jgi:hypothetical protein